MTKTVERSEILDYVSYDEQRSLLRASAMRAKDARRVRLGAHLTFLFENHETVRYQVQEMTRAERMVKEADIRRELEAYNELLGGPGEIGCTLLIELDDPDERAIRLARWLALPSRVYARMEDGSKVRASFDARQVGDSRLSAVQYLKFPVAGRVPAAIGCDLDDPELKAEALLTPEQRAALAADLG